MSTKHLGRIDKKVDKKVEMKNPGLRAKAKQ